MSTNENIANVILALHIAGGKSNWVHLEDVALEADKLAPGKYRWEKHKEHVSDRIIANWLSDAGKEKYGTLAVKRARQAKLDNEKLPKGLENYWRLTEAGVALAITLEGKVSNVRTKNLRVAEQKALEREKAQLLAEAAFSKFKSGAASDITHYEIERFFRVNEYITGEARKGKVTRLKNLFSADDELAEVIDALGQKLLEHKNV